MSRYHRVAAGRAQGANLDDEQGIHYHYHYYGTAQPVPVGDPVAQGGPYAPGAVTSGPVNLHRHPAADSLVKGLVVGAGLAYLLTNEQAQRALLKTAVQVWSGVTGGIEEWKERLRDAQAEAPARSPESGIQTS